jgi:hypothetical protein
MPISHALITLSDTTAVRIVENHNQPHDVILHNHTKSSNEYIYVGGPNVSDTNAMHIDPGQTIYLKLPPRDELWAVSDPDGLQVGVTDIRKGP